MVYLENFHLSLTCHEREMSMREVVQVLVDLVLQTRVTRQTQKQNAKVFLVERRHSSHSDRTLRLTTDSGRAHLPALPYVHGSVTRS